MPLTVAVTLLVTPLTYTLPVPDAATVALAYVPATATWPTLR